MSNIPQTRDLYLSKAMKGLKEQFGIEKVATELNGEITATACIDAEEAVLGVILIEKDAIWYVSDILLPEMFYNPQHKLIYKTILEMTQKRLVIDLITVTNQLRGKTDELGEPVTAYYLTQLTSRVASAEHITYHAHLIIQYYGQNQLFRVLNSALQIVKELDIEDSIEYCLSKIYEVENIFNGQKDAKDTRSLADEVTVNYINKTTLLNKGIEPGLPYGFRTMEEKFGRIASDDLIIVAARPSIGKTSFAISMAIKMAEMGIPVAFFSIESSAKVIMTKIASMILEIPSRDIRQAQIDDEEKYQKFMSKAWANLPVFIDDESRLNITKLTAKVRKLIINKGIQIVIIDYLQKMRSDEPSFSRTDEIGKITGGLKAINKRFDIPIICLSQLNRGSETRADNRPTLSDLRSSGDIEQDADIVHFIHRERNPYEETLERFQSTTIICEKNRNDTTGDIELIFDRHYTKFKNSINDGGDIPF